MREFRFILGRRALLIILAFLVATGAFIGLPTATQILADSFPPFDTSGTSPLVDTPDSALPTISITSPTAGAHWQIGTDHDITWIYTGLHSTEDLTILLARDGVNFTETITTGLTDTTTHYLWMVTGPGTINAKICVQQAVTPDYTPSPHFSSGSAQQSDTKESIDYSAISTNSLSPVTEGISAEFIISTPFAYNGTPINTSDPWLEISGETGTGTFWVIPLDPSTTGNPDLNRFAQETGKRSALFFDIGQEGFTPTTLFTVVLHYTPQLGEETFVFFRWNETGWISVPGTLDTANHTFTFQVLASEITGTPFALGGDPAAMPSLSPWVLVLLSVALLGSGGWWVLRRRRFA